MMTPEKKPDPMVNLNDTIMNSRRDVEITLAQTEAVMAQAAALLAGSYKIIRNIEDE